MTYIQSLKWLLSHLPMYQRQGVCAYKPGLDRILKFCQYLGNPQHNFKSIHIAGTNGKGSISCMLASILQEANYHVGLFSSPHLKDFRERIRFNNLMVSKKIVNNFINRHSQIIKEYELSFFEMTTAMAFDAFRELKVDVAVIETGLGGRLDSTNIILPNLSIITNISYDHCEILGDTIEQIALEKAGIIKKETPVVIGICVDQVRAIFHKISKEQNASIYFAKESLTELLYFTPLRGNYQRFNQQTVLKAIDVLRKNSWKISSRAVKDGFSKVIKNTMLRGRWEYLSYSPLIIVDIAHNEDGIRKVVEQLTDYSCKNLRLILGFVRDKEIKKMLSLFPKNAIYYFCQPFLDRAFSIDELKDLTRNAYDRAYYFNSAKKALIQAKKDAHKQDIIFVGGSTFVVADII